MRKAVWLLALALLLVGCSDPATSSRYPTGRYVLSAIRGEPLPTWLGRYKVLEGQVEFRDYQRCRIVIGFTDLEGFNYQIDDSCWYNSDGESVEISYGGVAVPWEVFVGTWTQARVRVADPAGQQWLFIR